MCDVMNKKFGIKGKECYLKNDSTLYCLISSDFYSSPVVPVPDRAVSVRDTD